MDVKRRIQFKSYLFGKMLATKTRKIVLALYFVFVAFEIVFIDAIQNCVRIGGTSILFRETVLIFFFFLSIAVSFGLELWYITTTEYKYLCTLAISTPFRLYLLISRPLYMIGFFICATIAFSFEKGVHLLLRTLLSSFCILATSTFLSHFFLRIGKRLRMCKASAYISCFLFLAVVFLLGVIVHIILIITRQSMFCFISKPNYTFIIICTLWLLLLCRYTEPYEISSRKYRIKSNATYSKSIPSCLLENLFLKDVSVALSNITYLMISSFFICAATYVRIMHADQTLLMIIAVSSSFFLSTVSEELIKTDIRMLPTIYTLSVKPKLYFSISILSTAITLLIPSFLIFIIILSCPSLDFLGFIVSLLGSCILGIAMCALQCTIVYDGMISNYSTQMILLFSIILSLFFPPYLILYLGLQYKRVQNKFSGGRG